jgi:hypothetical protein
VGQDVDDGAVRALLALRAGLERTLGELSGAAERADQLIDLRRRGHSWFGIVSTEQAPLIVETLTRTLEDLGELGSTFRRAEALALQREGVNITRIWRLFRISRQRASALVNGITERPTRSPHPGSSIHR